MCSRRFLLRARSSRSSRSSSRTRLWKSVVKVAPRFSSSGRCSRRGWNAIEKSTDAHVNDFEEGAGAGAGAGHNSGGGERGGGGGGDGHGGDESEGGEYWGEVSPFVASLSKGINTFPADLRKQILSGMVPLVFVKRYVELQANWVMSVLMRVPGIRNKLLADPSLAFKLGIELGIGFWTKSAAEYQKRKPYFGKEIDFVVANVLMALIADYMLVYLSAPTLVFKASKKARGGFLGLLSRLLPSVKSAGPRNAFQKVPLGMAPFTPLQRMSAIGMNGVKLFGIGFFASFVGVDVTNLLIGIRQKLAPDAPPLHKPQNAVNTSLLYGAYMGLNSNLRYQAVAGIEERLLRKVFTQSTRFTAASATLRVANTYLGSLLWVDTLRLVGMQPKEAS